MRELNPVSDLNGIRIDQQLLPEACSVRVRINGARLMENRAGDIRVIGLELRVVNPIEVRDPNTGKIRARCWPQRVFTSFMDLCVWHDPKTRKSLWWQSRRCYIPMKGFLAALEINPDDAGSDDDAFLESLSEREVLVDIELEEETVLDETTGKREKTGAFRARFKNWQKAYV